MDDGRSSGVQEVKAFEDLSAPRAQNLDFHDLETLQVTVGERDEHNKEGGEERTKENATKKFVQLSD